MARSSVKTKGSPFSRKGFVLAKKIVLSLFILFHLFIILVAPNMQSYLGVHLKGLIENYAVPLGLKVSWGFYAPDPGPPPVYLEWEIFDQQGAPLGTGKWPTSSDPFFFRERQTRRLNAVGTMLGYEDRIEKMMVPYLCEQNSKGFSVQIWSAVYDIPSSSDVAQGKRTLNDGSQVTRKWISQGFCREFHER